MPSSSLLCEHLLWFLMYHSLWSGHSGFKTRRICTVLHQTYGASIYQACAILQFRLHGLFVHFLLLEMSFRRPLYPWEYRFIMCWLLFSTSLVSFFVVQSSVMTRFLQQGAWKIFSWSLKLLHWGLPGSWQNYFFKSRDGMFLCISEPPRRTESNECSRSAGRLLSDAIPKR